ncbi:hypothetical protein FB451DRAFT_1551352 [Mycena latifolia]|nr:hypothetical protein FB451DRAFT_1551352 [Mycena latifolia]
MVLCPECNPPCELGTTSLDMHKRNVHYGKCKLTYADGVQVTVKRNPDTGKFHCRCGTGYTAGGPLQHHAKACRAFAPGRIPEDPDQSAGGATTRVNPEVLGRTESFRHRSLGPPPDQPFADAMPLFPEDSFDSDVAIYAREPGADTIITHPDYDLQSYDLVINTLLHAVICLSCGHCLEPFHLESHVRAHTPYIPVPAGMSGALRREFSLRGLAKLTAHIPRTFPAPIFGLALTNQRYKFCNQCGHGFGSASSLCSHQTARDRCPKPPGAPSTHTEGHGQQFTNGAYNVIFQVDPTKLPLKSESTAPSPVDIFFATPRPCIDYSKVPFAPPPRDLDLNSFALREGWMRLIDGYTPEELSESCRLSTSEDGELHELRDLVVGYITSVQPEIEKHASFGLQKLLAHVGLNDSLAGFNTIIAASCDKYGSTLWRLVFNLLRQIYDPYPPPFTYPLTSLHRTALKKLVEGLRDEFVPDAMASLVHTVVQSLFSHKKNDNKLDKFFSPVCCFLVLYSLKASGQFHLSSTITSIIMQLIYANRSTQLLEMRRLMDEDEDLDIYGAFELVKVYLEDMQETPMAYLFNVYNLLKVIRSDEHAEDAASWTDRNGMELTYDGNHIQIADFKELYDRAVKEYTKIVAEEIFRGRDVSQHPVFAAVWDIRKMVDDPKNRSPGTCFLDNPKNVREGFSDAFAEWILSDPKLSEEFVYVHDGELVWRPGPAFEMLEAMDRANDKLVLASVVGAAACGRGSDLANQFLRNVPGSPIRNLQILYHNLCMITLQDKTSHKRLKDRYIPAATPLDLAAHILLNLSVFRPFQVFLATKFIGDSEGKRFNDYLHPRIRRNLTSDQLSRMLGDATEAVLGARLTMLPWRKVVSMIGRRHGDPREFEMAKSYFFDVIASHSSSTGSAVYQVAGGTEGGIPPEHIVGCIRFSMMWQRLTGIDHGHPLRVSSVGEDLMGDEQASGLTDASDSAPSIDAANTLGALNLDQLSAHVVKALQPQLSQALKQAVLLEKIATKRTNILAIMRCGTGKTFMTLFAVKKYGHGNTSFFILPHSGLHWDFERRAREMGLSCAKWNPEQTYDEFAQVVWAAVEHIRFEDFKKFLSTLFHQKRLDRIVFDECHRLLTDIDYREIFDWIYTLGDYGVRSYSVPRQFPHT